MEIGTIGIQNSNLLQLLSLHISFALLQSIVTKHGAQHKIFFICIV